MISFQWPICVVLLPLPWILHKLLNYIRRVKSKGNSYKFAVDECSKIKQEDLDADPTICLPDISNIQQAFLSADNSSNITSATIAKKVWLAAWLFVILALMRPVWLNKPLPTTNYGYDLMLAIDLSLSMHGLDLSRNNIETTRLDVVKQAVDEFVSNRQGDRLGLIVFAENAYQLVPFTYDLHAFRTQVKQLAVGMAGDTTSIGDAIGLSVKAMRDRKGDKILILLTDGEDTSSSIPPLQAAELAVKYGIKVYTIGIGRDGLAPIRDGNGQLVMFESKVDEKLLHDIAKITYAAYAKADDAEQLQRVYQQINNLEQSEGKAKVVIMHTTLHRYPIVLAFICLILLFVFYRRSNYAY